MSDRPNTVLPWAVVRRTCTVAQAHGDPVDMSRRAAIAYDITDDAWVLGSAQQGDTTDQHAVAAQGLSVVRRRSGGGGVLVLAGEMIWIDVVVPRSDPLWDDDVGRSMWWLGDAWVAALAAVGVAADVHRGGLVRNEWSAHVCFAGLGSGEVVDDAGRKVVGISQRRDRWGCRLQSMCHLRWRPDRVAELIALASRPGVPLPPVAVVPHDLASSVLDVLTATSA